MATLPIQLLLVLVLALSAGCSARETHHALEPSVLPQARNFNQPPVPVVIGEFINRSTYMNGIFADSSDKLGLQGKQILTTHLSQSPAFIVSDRQNMEALSREAGYNGSKQKILGGKILITGAVTEFGRKETGTRSLGGLIHKTKTQTLYAKVSLSIVDVDTAEVYVTYQGAGEYNLTNKEVLGVGGYAGYDSTLADKVLNFAIMETIQRMIEGRQAREW